MRNGSAGAPSLPKRTSPSGRHRLFVSSAGSQSHRDIEHGNRIRLGTNVVVAFGLSLLMAVSVGLAFSIEKDSANILRVPIFKMELPVLDHHPAK